MQVVKSIEKQINWKVIVAVLTAGWITIWIYRTALTPIYPAISAFFGGVSNRELGTISSFYFLGYVIMQIPSGLLVDRFGQKHVILPGFALFGIGTLIVALSQTLPILYLGSIIAGLGCGTFYGCAYSLTALYVPKEKKSVSTAIVNSGMAIGSGLGLVSSSYFVGRGIWPWQAMMYACIILIVCMLLVFLKVLKNRDASEVSEKNEGTAAKTSIKSLFRPQLVTAYVLYFSTMYAYYLIDTWLPNFLETERGFEGTAIGIASSLVFFAAIPGALIFSRVADKLPHKKVQIIVALEIIAALMLLFMINTGSQAMLLAGIVAYGFFGKLAVEPIIISWLSEFATGGSVATMYGFFNFFGMTSSVIAPIITGHISDITGTKILGFYLAIVIIFIGTGLFYVVNKISSQKKEI